VTEEEAQDWLLTTLGVSRETLERLDAFRVMVIAENDRQNLVSAASIPGFWARHIVDSAQLIPLAPETGRWIDLGTGAGFPGVVIAILRDQPITLVESRRKRANFLAESVMRLALTKVEFHGGRLETLSPSPFSVISARAFAPLHRLLPIAHSFSTAKTRWLLPKGRSAREEVASVAGVWQGAFHVEPSITDAEAAIIVAHDVRPAAKRGRI
jgi:16S rRNA (guanine527-N7)-methyltransferase